MTPRRLAIAAAALLASAVVVVSLRGIREQPFRLVSSAERNVLLITVDTLRADALGVYGGRAVTPNIDRLAASGARFDFAHAHAVVTLPSHASILSGRYPYEHGVRDNTGYRFPRDMPTVATLLQGHGLATGAFIGGFPLVQQFGLTPGFDTYDDRLSTGLRGERSEAERPAAAVVEAALDWIGSRDRRWFAWVHVYDPHTPYAPTGEWASRFASDPYLGEVSATDAALAPLLARAASGPRPTLVVLTADHGEALGDHGEPTHGTFAYEPVLRVPLIISEVGPGLVARDAGAIVHAPARHVDIAPTILAALGYGGGSFAGTSLLDVIAEREGSDRPSYFEAMSAAVGRGWAPLRGVIVDREKYIDLPLPELYDLTADPAERTNLVGSRGTRQQVLFNVLKGFDLAPPARAQAETAATIERLRSLGYVGGASAAAKERYTEEDDPKKLIDLERRLAEAASALGRGSAAEAERLYREVIDRRPDMEDAYRKLALLYWRTDRPAQAVATLESAIKQGITQDEVIVKLGQYLAESGQPARAIELLTGRFDDDPDALIILGNAYAYSGRYADARRTFERTLQLNPRDAVAQENLGAMQLQMRELAAAESTLRSAIALDPSRAGAHTTLGVLLAQTGRRDEAIRMWTRALELDPNDSNARDNLRAVR